MGFSLVQSKVGSTPSGGTTPPQSLSFGSAVSSGNTVIVAAAGNVSSGGQPTISITDDKSNTYTLETSQTNGWDAAQNTWLQVFVASGITNGPTTITLSTSAPAAFIRMILEEWSGIASTNFIDGNNIQLQSGTNSLSSGNFTPAVSGDLIWGATLEATGDTSANASAGSGFTAGNTTGTGGVVFMSTENKVQTSAGSTSTTFTITAGVQEYITGGIALKAGSSMPLGYQGARTVIFM